LDIVDRLETVRQDFPALKQEKNNQSPIYFDNACTTLVPQKVIEALNEYYSGFPSCGGARSRYWFATEVSSRIEGDADRGIKGSRQVIQEFIHAGSPKEIIFTTNTSHSINIVALGFKFKPGDCVLISDREHNSNLIPWLRLQQKGLIKLLFVRSDRDGVFDLSDYQAKLKNHRISLVSLAFTSNLTGETLPAREIVSLAHNHGALIMLDAAQTAPHQSLDVQDLDVDFLALSLHKMCGPRGIGILYAKAELLGQSAHPEHDPLCMIEPVILGGGTVADSNYQSYTLLEPPESFEVGVQDYAGQIASAAALNYLQQIGMDKIRARETQMNSYLTRELLDRYGRTGWFRILGPRAAERRGGILTFEVKRPNAVGIAEELDLKRNIMIRDGAFCVHSYLNKEFGPNWISPRLPSEHRMTYRVSLYFYNTLTECEAFLSALDEIFKERSYI
jgi:cysteine desulfurase / selenocysteine lyase